MDRRKIKTALIFLLALLNLFLLGQWAVQRYTYYTSQRAAGELLSAQLAEIGLTAQPGTWPTSVCMVYDSYRNPEKEAKAVSALLGEYETLDLGGGIVEYQSTLGAARLRGSGDVDIQLTLPRYFDDPEADLRELAAAMGLIAGPETARLEPEADGYALLGTQSGFPVWEQRLLFTLEEGRLTQIAGRWPMGADLRETAAQSRSAGSALLALAWSRQEAGAGPAVLLGMELGYRMNVLSPSVIRLVPYWYIRLDDEDVYVAA